MFIDLAFGENKVFIYPDRPEPKSPLPLESSFNPVDKYLFIIESGAVIEGLISFTSSISGLEVTFIFAYKGSPFSSFC
jgi:hypothetical protein